MVWQVISEGQSSNQDYLAFGWGLPCLVAVLANNREESWILSRRTCGWIPVCENENDSFEPEPIINYNIELILTKCKYIRYCNDVIVDYILIVYLNCSELSEQVFLIDKYNHK